MHCTGTTGTSSGQTTSAKSIERPGRWNVLPVASSETKIRVPYKPMSTNRTRQHKTAVVYEIVTQQSHANAPTYEAGDVLGIPPVFCRFVREISSEMNAEHSPCSGRVYTKRFTR